MRLLVFQHVDCEHPGLIVRKPVQTMRLGNSAWSTQYHVEVEEDKVDNWGVISAYRSAME